MPANSLAHLKPGQTGVISAIHTDELLHHRLQALGFRIGKRIAVVRQSGASGPIQVRIGTTDLIIRPSEARHISITHQ